MKKLSAEHLKKLSEGRKATSRRPRKERPVLCANGLYLLLSLTRKQAEAAFCTECLGFEGNPKSDCTSKFCPLYPYRAKTRLTLAGTMTKQQAVEWSKNNG